MPLDRDEALALAQELAEIRDNESTRLNLIRQYLRDDPDDRRLGGIPNGAPQDVVRLAKLSRVNLLKFVVNSRVQAMFVDGIQTPDSPDNLAVWEAWQRNRMDARQVGLHRAALAYGAAYATVMPGDPVPVIRGASPRALTAAYAGDDDWPQAALQQLGNGRWRLIDNEAVYTLTKSNQSDRFELVDTAEHGMTWDGQPVTPVVRYRDTDDLDDPVRGVVEPLMPLQDQVNITTFGLQVAQHYGAFRQRYIIGWLAESEQQALKTGASKLMMFEDDPSQIKVGEFAQTELRGYIDSREATIRHLATVSQTPVHEILGEMINMAAEALEAARASHHAAVDENRIMAGESHEQTLGLAGEAMGAPPDPSATVVWRDTRVRSLTEAAGAFRDLVEGLGVPPRALWPRIPGVAQHELARWESLADEGDAFDDLARLLDRQASGADA